MKRRTALHALAGLGAAALMPLARGTQSLNASNAKGRVAVVGGGWGGLSAAAHLARALPGWDIALFEQRERFFSLPLSNAWLIDRVDEAMLVHDYARAATQFGYRFIHTTVRGIDRTARRIASDAGRFDYDWLVLAPGIAERLDPWVDGDPDALATLKTRFDGAFTGPDGVRDLKTRLQRFTGGDIVLTVPPAPYRCPPTPYERAIALATWMDRKQLPGRIMVVDPGTGMAGYRDAFDRQFGERIRFMPFARIERVDPHKQVLVTDFDEIPFTEAILAGPQQAGPLVSAAGLERDDTGWADVDGRTLQSRADERVFIIGDAVGLVSPLFGHYPKTGHIAVHHGRIAAAGIAAGIQGKVFEAPFPESTCWVYDSFDPPEMVRIDASYRVRGDGALTQQIDQARENQPRGEELAWARGMFAELFGAR